MWFNQYITFFFTEHFKFISICFEVLRGLCWSIATMNTRKRIHENWIFGSPFCFEMDKVTSYWPLNRLWKRILHFTFTEIGCPATGPGELKFITDSLPLFGLKETFLIAKSEASMMWGDAMPHEMKEFTKKVSSTLLKKTHHRLCFKKITMSDSVCFYLQSIKATNVRRPKVVTLAHFSVRPIVTAVVIHECAFVEARRIILEVSTVRNFYIFM